MSREWTPRRRSTLNIAAIDPTAFRKAYALHRADLEPSAALRQALRLLTAFTFLWLPVHCGICWLSTYSLALAATVVVITAVTLFAVALAKWLALEDLLQMLPLLLVLALIVVGVAFFTSAMPWWGQTGAGNLTSLLILIAVVSVLGGLYRPMAAAYQTVTLKTHFRDLCVGAAAMLLSLGVVALCHVLPKFGMEVLACGLAGGYAGLVVIEYAAWARANPNVDLKRSLEFGKPVAKPGGTDDTEEEVIAPRGAVLWAIVFGLSFGGVIVVLANIQSPSPEFRRLVLAEKDLRTARELLQSVLLLGVMVLVGSFYVTSTLLSGLRPGNPLLAFRLAGQALVVFLTYPETTPPLVHRLLIPWLRPHSVRRALTGLVLVTAATAIYGPTEKPRSQPAEEPKAPAHPTPFFVTQPPPPHVSQGDLDLAQASGQPPELWLGPKREPSPATPSMPMSSEAAAATPADSDGPGFFALVVGLVFGPPVLLYTMTCFVGLTVLPTYFRYFESPASTDSKV